MEKIILDKPFERDPLLDILTGNMSMATNSEQESNLMCSLKNDMLISSSSLLFHNFY